MKVVIHNHLPTRDASPEMQAFLERKAAKIAEAKAGEARMDQLLARVKVAKKIIKKRGDTPYNGYAAGAERYVTGARAMFGLAINSLNNGAMYKHEEMMAKTVEPEKIANEATQAIERQAAERGGGSRDAKSRLSKKESDDLYDAKRLVFQFRELADKGDENAKKIVANARETVAKLTAKRDNKIWL